MDSKDIFLVAALLCAGALLRFILVLFGELVTPNVLVAFYSIAIMLILPSFGEAIGIGLVSGIITALISQSVINHAFLLSEPLGAAVCLLVFITLRYHKRAAPYAAAFAATIASGVVFAVLCRISCQQPDFRGICATRRLPGLNGNGDYGNCIDKCADCRPDLSGSRELQG